MWIAEQHVVQFVHTVDTLHTVVEHQTTTTYTQIWHPVQSVLLFGPLQPHRCQACSLILLAFRGNMQVTKVKGKSGTSKQKQQQIILFKNKLITNTIYH